MAGIITILPSRISPCSSPFRTGQGASLVVAGLIPQSNGAGAGMLEVHVLSYDKGAFQVWTPPLVYPERSAGMTAQITVPRDRHRGDAGPAPMAGAGRGTAL